MAVGVFERVRLGSFVFYAVVEDELVQENSLPSVEVEGGFAISHYGKEKAKTGSLTIFLLDGFTSRAGAYVIPASMTKERQKTALDGIFNLKKSGGTATLSGSMGVVNNVAIEGITYRRDKRTNLFAATVRWKEMRTAKTATVTFERTGKLDPVTNGFIDAPQFDQGYVVPPKANIANANVQSLVTAIKNNDQAGIRTYTQAVKQDQAAVFGSVKK